MLKIIGFEKINIAKKEISKNLIDEWAPGNNASDQVVSASIEAVKSIKK